MELKDRVGRGLLLGLPAGPAGLFKVKGMKTVSLCDVCVLFVFSLNCRALSFV